MAIRVDRFWTLFLDRDGVLNRKIPGGYVLEPSMLEVLPGVPEAMALLADRFGTIAIVTNQRGVGRGLMSAQDLGRVHDVLLAAVRRAGGRIDAVFACPHDLHESCGCRKPKPGLALQARARFPQIDFHRSVMVGDSDSDIEMGNALGMRAVLIGPDNSLLDFARALGNG